MLSGHKSSRAILLSSVVANSQDVFNNTTSDPTYIAALECGLHEEEAKVSYKQVRQQLNHPHHDAVGDLAIKELLLQPFFSVHDSLQRKKERKKISQVLTDKHGALGLGADERGRLGEGADSRCSRQWGCLTANSRQSE